MKRQNSLLESRPGEEVGSELLQLLPRGGEIILGSFPVSCAPLISVRLQETSIEGGSLPIGVF